MFRNIKRNQEYFSKIFKPGCSIIIFDTETTGLGKNAKIIEFGAVRFLITTKGLKETGKMDLFINPEETLSERIIEITGITDDILERAKNETIEAPAIFTFLESADFWGAYNCAFDLRMLEQILIWDTMNAFWVSRLKWQETILIRQKLKIISFRQ